MMERRIKYFDITPEMVRDMIMGRPRKFTSNIPEDARIVAVDVLKQCWLGVPDMFRIMIFSKDFEVVPVGEMPGEFHPEFKVVYEDQKPDGQGE